MTPAALADVRVLDLSRILAGPTAAQMLADFGAQVIKVERPGQGDDSRRLGGQPLRDRDGQACGLGPMFVSANRNKQSVTIDIAKPAGQELVRKLAAWADVLLENYKAGDLKRYGLDYESLRKINPRLVYCSVTGFGQSGPYSARPGYDGIFQAMSGPMSVTGHRDGMPGAGAMRVGVPITDIVGGAFAYGAIMTALHYRDQVSGEGQYIDLSLLECAIAAACVAPANYLCTGVVQERWGNEAGNAVPSRTFRCADGEVQVSAPANDVFSRLCKLLDGPDLVKDERFSDNLQRVKHREALGAVLEPLFMRKTRDQLIKLMEASNVPCAPIYAIDEVFADPHIQQRGTRVTVTHESVGEFGVVANPMRLSVTPVNRYDAPPLLGEHTEQVLSSVLGLDASAIARYRQEGVV